jgi:hypothetical protein
VRPVGTHGRPPGILLDVLFRDRRHSFGYIVAEKNSKGSLDPNEDWCFRIYGSWYGVKKCPNAVVRLLHCVAVAVVVVVVVVGFVSRLIARRNDVANEYSGFIRSSLLSPTFTIGIGQCFTPR